MSSYPQEQDAPYPSENRAEAPQYDDEMRTAPRLTADQEAQMVDRLYRSSLERKKANLEELDRRYYPVAAPQTISKEQLQKSVDRQVDTEMELRQQRFQQYDAQTYAEIDKMQTTKTISDEALAANIKHLYDDSIALKAANLEESKRRYQFDPSTVKTTKMPKSDFQASVERMSKPKKTEYTIEEINKIYGLSRA